MSKAKSVTDRLTDTTKYTGMHANRFDEEGKGRGLAGRAELVNYTGSTNAKAIEATVPHEEKKPVVHGQLGKQKFGTQATKVASCTFYRNGDKHHNGEKILLKGFKTFDQLLDKASSTVKLTTGAVRKIYKQGGKTQVKTLEDLADGGKYLCCGGEKPASDDKLPKGFLE